MFAYFRTHRRAASSNNTAPNSNPNNANPNSTPTKRPSSSSTPSSESTNNLPILAARSPNLKSPVVRFSPAPKQPAPTRYYAAARLPAEETEQPIWQDQNPTSPISKLPPVLPPIPSLGESGGDQHGLLNGLGLPSIAGPDEGVVNVPTEPKPSPLTSADFVSMASVEEEPDTMLQPIPSIKESIVDEQQTSEEKTTHSAVNQPVKQTRISRPISLAYKLDFGQNFTLDDESPIGKAGSGRSSAKSPLAQSPSSLAPSPATVPQETSQLTRSPLAEQELEPLSNSTSNPAISPTPSYRSFQRSASSGTLAADGVPLSPVSSRPNTSVSGPAPSITKLSKPRRSLLSPVSLLMRRRTSHNLDIMTDSSQNARTLGPAMNLPDDYDPRIKGKGVHDFSAPRPRRNYSANDLERVGTIPMGNASPVDEYKRRQSVPWAEEAGIESARSEKEKSPERSHKPTFIEHFESDETHDMDGSAVRREVLANQSFLSRVSENVDLGTPLPAPSLAVQQGPYPGRKEEKGISESIPLVRVSSDDTTAADSAIIEKGLSSVVDEARSSPVSSKSPKIQLLSPLEHHSSNGSATSRFSFQFASDFSVEQEHALEARHKQKAAERKPDSQPSVVAHSDDGDDDDDEQDMSDFDGGEDGDFEEPIPLLSADSHEEPAKINECIQTTSQEMPSKSDEGISPYSPVDLLSARAEHIERPRDKPRVEGHSSDPIEDDMPQKAIDGSTHIDDMYFDDGFIDEPSTGGDRFDESMFDAPFERGQLFQQPRSKPALGLDMAALNNKLGKALPNQFENNAVLEDPRNEDQPRSSTGLHSYHSALASAASRAEADGKFEREAQDKRDGSDNAIMRATGTSSQQDHNTEAGGFDTAPASNYWPTYLGEDYDTRGPVEEDYGSDDLEYDPIIAEANAEALAADDSGFYGREFNFYSNIKGGQDVHNGGFFGSPTKEGLGRSNSVLEPTLTPITERSEFSRVPSLMSMSPFASGINMAPLPSPGLKEIAARFGLDHEELTLKQLMRLRKEAFGGGGVGSAGSSPTSIPASSPLFMKRTSNPLHISTTRTVQEESIDKFATDEEREAYAKGPAYWDHSGFPSPSPTSPNMTLARKQPFAGSLAQSPTQGESYFSHSRQSSDGIMLSPPPKSKPSNSSPPRGVPRNISSPSSPLMPMPPQQLMQKFSARPPASSATYAERQAEAQHARNSSNGSATATGGAGTDSVAYVREDHGWYLEKRRTLTSGEVVVLGRELVEGGRI